MIFAWMGAALIGLSLGLLGSGGSILTVPVLVYLVGEPEKLAIAESLAIVGGISLIGAIPYALRRQIDGRSVLWFGIPGVTGTYLGAALSVYVSGVVQLLLFAVVMLLAAVMMFRPTQVLPPGHTAHPRSPLKIGAEGLGVGILTGLVGVGGGFLIIPALVLLGGLPMSLAVGTSLLIIAAKSFAGFYKYLHVLQEQNLAMHWKLILIFTVIGILGSFLGARVGKNMSNDSLKRGFAGFLVVMGLYVLATNVPKVLNPPAAEAYLRRCCSPASPGGVFPMTELLDLLRSPWPWYVGGPLIGLTVPLLLWLGNKSFGISSNLRHLCAVLLPNSAKPSFFRYDWKKERWNLLFAAGLILGGFVAGMLLANPEPTRLSAAGVQSVQDLGVHLRPGLVPAELTDLSHPGVWLLLALSGLLIGFGTRYGGGCTSGHAITGLSTLQGPSLIATASFFAGGILSANFLLPLFMAVIR